MSEEFELKIKIMINFDCFGNNSFRKGGEQNHEKFCKGYSKPGQEPINYKFFHKHLI